MLYPNFENVTSELWKRYIRTLKTLSSEKSRIVPKKNQRETLWSLLYFWKHKKLWFSARLERMLACFSDPKKIRVNLSAKKLNKWTKKWTGRVELMKTTSHCKSRVFFENQSQEKKTGNRSANGTNHLNRWMLPNELLNIIGFEIYSIFLISICEEKTFETFKQKAVNWTIRHETWLGEIYNSMQSLWFRARLEPMLACFSDPKKSGLTSRLRSLTNEQ